MKNKEKLRKSKVEGANHGRTSIVDTIFQGEYNYSML